MRRVLAARPAALLGLAAALLSGCAPGEPPAHDAAVEPTAYVCLLPGEKRMLVAELFFGRNVPGRAPVSEAEWADFAAQVITRYLPDGFTVHDELLGVPRADRLVCIPRNVTNAQIIRAIGKYVNGNPDKAHRATRLVASLALAQAFPCKRSK